MSRSRSCRTRLALTFWGATALLILCILYPQGQDWIEGHWLWWRVQRLQEIRRREPDHPAFAATENRGLSPFDVLLSRLIRLQDPGFHGGIGFELLPFRTEEGGDAFIAAYSPLDVPFDIPRDPAEMVEIIFDGCIGYTLLGIDERGRVLGKALGVRVRSPGMWRVRRGEGEGGHSVLHFSSCWPRCYCCTNLPRDAITLLSLDRHGLIERGEVTSDGLEAPLCFRGARPWVQGHSLDACVPGQSGHRLLTALKQGSPEDAAMASALLVDPDPGVRARAASLLGRDARNGQLLLPSLTDSDPRVRFAAIAGVRSVPDWETAIQPLLADPEPLVARRAHRELIHSRDRAVASRSVLALLAIRDAHVIRWSLCRVATPELAEALVDWLEDEMQLEDPRPVLYDLLCNLSRVPPDVLRTMSSRIVWLHRKGEARGEWMGGLGRALVRADAPDADAAIIEKLSRSYPHDSECDEILAALVARDAQLRGAHAPRVLAHVLETGGPHHETEREDTRTAAALLLARRGSLKALIWLLSRYGRGEPGEWPLEGLWIWMQAHLADVDPCELETEGLLELEDG